jgi:hypothetical protein
MIPIDCFSTVVDKFVRAAEIGFATDELFDVLVDRADVYVEISLLREDAVAVSVAARVCLCWSFRDDEVESIGVV